VLKHDLRGRALDVPVIYPGSIERTSFAERDEEKGYFILELEGLENAVRRTIAQLPEDAVVQLRILGSVQQDARQVLGANYLRSLAPPTMNVEARLVSVSRET
jgi:DNA repair exonuclease SbcCD nuclease subunit